MRVHALGYDMNGDALCIVCRHISEDAPVAEVAHDRDGVVQILCASYDHGAADAVTIHLHHVAPLLASLDLPTVHPGQYAQRTEGGWAVTDMPPEEEEA
ncbi:hypothetical protein ACETK8_13720 [Brevundimonas staleyi]|uniref:Uncharacterized protein n=1 Tax=Brevundimonas staleyi TaxID=74326 RepID=A0ABW0FRS5_9CAUL